MTTPTKEQITEIIGQMQKRGLYWDGIDYEDEYAVLRFIITEWEKIKDVDARVEKLYKLGTQDWVDFYKAINSPK